MMMTTNGTRRARLVAALSGALALLMLAGCPSLGDGDGGGGPLVIDVDMGGGGGDMSADQGPVVNNTTGGPDGPKIIEVSPQAPAISGDRGSVTFTVVVTDPDGASDLLGGLVRDGITGETIVSMTRTGEGTFSAVVTWEALHAQAPISFEGSGQRVVLLEFIDAAEHRTRQSVTIALSCPNSGEKACGGRCQTLCLVLGSACVPGQAPERCTCTNSANLTEETSGLATHVCTFNAEQDFSCNSARELGEATLCPAGGNVGCMPNPGTQSVLAVCQCDDDTDCPSDQRCVAVPQGQPVFQVERLCVARAQ